MSKDKKGIPGEGNPKENEREYEVDKAFEDTIKELILNYPEDLEIINSEGGIPKDKPDRLYLRYMQVIVNKYIPFSSEISVKELMKEDIEKRHILHRAIESNREFKDLLYTKTYTRLKTLEYTELTYGELFTEITLDTLFINEIFLRIVEETEGVSITSWEQLQELTGIRQIGADNDTVENCRATAIEHVKDCFTLAMRYRYINTLEDMLEAGAQYKDLLSVDLAKYYLSTEYQEKDISRAIGLYFNLGGLPGEHLTPRDVVDRIGAPYSLVLAIANKERINEDFGNKEEDKDE